MEIACWRSAIYWRRLGQPLAIAENGDVILHVFSVPCFVVLYVFKMPPRKKRQRAGAMNYLKRRDVAEGPRVGGAVGRDEFEERRARSEWDDSGSVIQAERVRGSGEVVRDDGGSGQAARDDGRSEEATRDDGGSRGKEATRDDGGSEEAARDEPGSRTVEQSEEAECGPSSEAPIATKRRRLSAIAAMGDEPLQEWLDNLPREDLQHTALLLYTRLPVIFGIKKTETAAAVGEILQKNERTIRRWVDDFASNEGEFSDSQKGHYTRNNTLMSNEEICEKARVYVRENAAPRGRPNLTAAAFCQWV